MPVTKSAIKRVKTSERNRQRNLDHKTQIKTIIKKILELVQKKDVESAKKAANTAFAIIDRSTTKRILHKRSAARKKSRISKWLKSLEKR